MPSNFQKQSVFQQFSTKVKSIAFVSSGFGNSGFLLEHLNAKNIVQLNDQSNQIEQISQALSSYQNLDSIHIFSHGFDGALQLGDITLNQASLDEYGQALSAWGDALSKSGDLLFYGCNVAAGDGVSFVRSVSQLTGADVAASVDLTGHASLMGDWQLEYATGSIEAGSAASAALQESYEGVLASNLIEIHAKGNEGSELFALEIDGQEVARYSATQSYQTYSYQANEAIAAERISVRFLNDWYRTHLRSQEEAASLLSISLEKQRWTRVLECSKVRS